MYDSAFTIRAAALAVFLLIVSGPVASLYGAVADLSSVARSAALAVESRRL